MEVFGCQTIWELLVKRVQTSPQKVCLIDGDHEGCQLTFLELLDRVESVAAHFYGLGIGPQSVVAWMMPTRLETIIVSLALCRLGATQNPILHLYREKELGQILEQSKPSFLMVPETEETVDYPALAKKVAEPMGVEVMVISRELPRADRSNLPPPPTEGDKARWIYCTSGTTSGPKGVLHTDRSLIAGGHALVIALQLRDDDVGSITYPFTHIGGLMYMVMVFESGMSAVIVERIIVEQTAAIFRHHRVTITGGSTAHYQMWLELQRKNPETPVFPDMRFFTGGGASKPPQLFYSVQKEMGFPIVHSYGMTESVMVASNGPDDSDEDMAYTDGIPVVGMEFFVQRPDGSRAEAGEVGEIMIRGACLCQGYLNPAQNIEAFDKEGFFHTGDLGFINDQGRISLTGRLKDLIIRKGENISAREIEELLALHPKVKAVAVIGLPDEQRGERVCAVVELREAPLTLQEVTDYLAGEGLMKQKLPEQLEIVERMPRSETFGKISKKELRQQFSSINA